MHHLLTIDVRGHDPDVIGAQLWSLGVVGIEDLGSHLTAAFADRKSAVRAAEALGAEPLIESVRDDEGLDTWREFASWVEAGPFVICPSWIDPPDGSDLILIDPGHAFGSGSHPSTRLAVEAIAHHVGPGSRVLDVGCGSGVLSIAAALLGASVTAVDIDERAVEATRANAETNRCADQVSVRLGSAADVDDTFDLVAVNVTIDVQDSIAADVADRLAPGGVLVASGILAGAQERRLSNNFPVLDLIERTTEAEWAAVCMRREGQPS